MKKYLLFILLFACYMLQAVNGELITQQDRKIMKLGERSFPGMA